MNIHRATRYGSIRLAACLASVVGLTLAGAAAADAFSMSSGSYQIDNGATNNFGGDANSSQYKLTSSGGEAFIGPGSSETYRFNAGYVASLEHSITLTLDSLAVTIPQVTPGTSRTATSVVSVFTDAAGYSLSARQDRDLTHDNGSAAIPGVGATIASPATWIEGTTKGLGFTLTAGSSIESKWGTNPNYNYAAFPADSTVIHDKPLYQNTYDDTTVQYRVDVLATQLPGRYRNNVTFNAVVKP